MKLSTGPRLCRLLLATSLYPSLALLPLSPVHGATNASQATQNSPTPKRFPVSGSLSPGELRWEQLKLKQDWPHQFARFDSQFELAEEDAEESARHASDGTAGSEVTWLDARCRAARLSRSGEAIVGTVLLDAYQRRRELGVAWAASVRDPHEDPQVNPSEFHAKQMELYADQESVTSESIARLKQQLGEADFKRYDKQLCESEVDYGWAYIKRAHLV
jgi:hypothetical protein